MRVAIFIAVFIYFIIMYTIIQAGWVSPPYRPFDASVFGLTALTFVLRAFIVVFNNRHEHYRYVYWFWWLFSFIIVFLSPLCVFWHNRYSVGFFRIGFVPGLTFFSLAFTLPRPGKFSSL